jgi:CO dehydrogenase/acetyl-CoA synthase beta subunit
MNLFESAIKEIRSRLSGARPALRASVSENTRPPWPRRGIKQMILEQDMGAELGNGRYPSFSAILWTSSQATVEDGLISLYGQDIPQIAACAGNTSVPFGKLVLLGVEPIPDDGAYAFFERLDAVRFVQNLEGYMLRGTTQRNREWSRVSRIACEQGFDFPALGRELIRDYKALPSVLRAEVVFLSEDRLIRELSPVAEDCAQITRALNTMFTNINTDCAACDSAVICSEVQELSRLHKNLNETPNAASPADAAPREL